MAKGRAVVPPQRVVGIGASAGGLDALKHLVHRIPNDTGLAFVILQHLPPSQTGKLAELLAHETTLPVVDAKSGHRIAPDTISIVPPHTSAGLSRGALVLRTAKAGARPRMPIDALFGSLAAALGERAVGVVLSGTANDGTEGLRAIQTAGGLTFAQDPSTAQFDEMPRSAIAARAAGMVLAPGELGAELGAIAKLSPAKVATAAPGLERILDQLREASGIDFTSYKRTTIERRLARRVTKLRLASLDDYGRYLDANPDEATGVYEDLLIHVTEFFRDSPVLELVVDRLLADPAAPDAPIRVWVPGCSTGEEVYSLAILLLERTTRPLHLFGSDLSERAIETARTGHYPASVVAQVGPVRLARFFRRVDTGYRINQDVRERCVFARHDLVTDPPFSKLDVVSCRNVLIYLGAALQNRVIPLFHYALNQPGYLVLGRAEAITGFDSLFATADANARIYTRKPAARAALTFPLAGQLGRLPWRRVSTAYAQDVQRDVDHVLLARYSPACVLVDANLDVIQFRGRTGPYLEAPPGQPQLNVLRMAREGIATELQLAIQSARRTDAPVRRDNVAIRERGHDRHIHIEVIPMRSALESERNFLIVFEAASEQRPVGRAAARASRPAKRGDADERHRQELVVAKEQLHALMSQHLVISEELGLANEELQSANEELQSNNEEIQTAREELQSTNEELETVNEELQRNNALLHEANDDLENVLASVEIAIIIVDADRRVRRFTPKARAVMKLIPSDVGRPIIDLQPSVTVSMLDQQIAAVIESLETRESEVRHVDGSYYRMQIRPYRTVDRKIGGAVVAFVEITALRNAREHAAAIVETVPTPLVVLDDRLRIQSANPAFFAAFGGSAVVGRNLLELGDWSLPTLGSRLDAVFVSGTGFDAIDLEHADARGSRMLRLGARAITPADGGRRLVLVAIADITEQRRAEAARETTKRERDAFLDAVSHELRTPLSAILLWAQALRELDHDDPRRMHAIETIVDSARSEARMVDDLLEIAQSRAAQLAVKLESIDPVEVIATAVDTARASAAAKHVAIETALAAGRRITVDPRRLVQIAVGLLSNAIQFTPEGGRVEVRLAVEDGVMELRVRDSGPGIAAEFLPHVFQPFAQGDTSSTRPHRGLGLGLALVRHLVERHQGTIHASSEGGRGATFTVRIPVAPAH